MTIRDRRIYESDSPTNKKAEMTNWKKTGSGGDAKFVGGTLLKERFEKEGGPFVVAEGLYSRTIPNQFDEEKPSFLVETEEGGMAINWLGNLGIKFRQVPVGSLVKVTYNGMEEISSGKWKGAKAHQFDVLYDDSSVERDMKSADENQHHPEDDEALDAAFGEDPTSEGPEDDSELPF